VVSFDQAITQVICLNINEIPLLKTFATHTIKTVYNG